MILLSKWVSEIIGTPIDKHRNTHEQAHRMPCITAKTAVYLKLRTLNRRTTKDKDKPSREPTDTAWVL